MGRARKHHEQTSMMAKLERKPDKNGQWRGGKREGAGRKPGTGRRNVLHRERPQLRPELPLLVTLRMTRELGWLRKLSAYRALRRALRTVLEHAGHFRVVHFSLQGDHVHLLCEARDKAGLTLGMRSLEIAAAKHLNRELTPKGRRRRRGQVFVDRYHVEVLSSPRQCRNAISYVLNNWRKHAQDRRVAGLYGGRIDPYSSGVYFFWWKERTCEEYAIPAGYDPPGEISIAQTWLLGEGYLRAGPISVYEVPGPAHVER